MQLFLVHPAGREDYKTMTNKKISKTNLSEDQEHRETTHYFEPKKGGRKTTAN